MLAYPVMGSYQINRKFLLAQLNDELAKGNKPAAANWAAQKVHEAVDSIDHLHKVYNGLLKGKWKGMMMLPPGIVAKYHLMPDLVYTEGAGSKPFDLTPRESKKQLECCTVIKLKNFSNKVSKDGHTLSLIDGIGYDWYSIQLGEATEQTADPADLNGTRFEYEFSAVDANSVTVYVYSAPFFPLYKGKSTRYGISVDGQAAFIANNKPTEFSKEWKDQVLQNGVVATATFPVQKNSENHTLTLSCGDPGIVIQRIVIDWGGLKDSYIGPSPDLNEP
jgi:hypothetical protein